MAYVQVRGHKRAVSSARNEHLPDTNAVPGRGICAGRRGAGGRGRPRTTSLTCVFNNGLDRRLPGRMTAVINHFPRREVVSEISQTSRRRGWPYLRAAAWPEAPRASPMASQLAPAARTRFTVWYSRRVTAWPIVNSPPSTATTLSEVGVDIQ